MALKKYKVIWSTAINVLLKPREVGEVFEADSKEKEIPRLIQQKYIVEVE